MCLVGKGITNASRPVSANYSTNVPDRLYRLTRGKSGVHAFVEVAYTSYTNSHSVRLRLSSILKKWEVHTYSSRAAVSMHLT